MHAADNRQQVRGFSIAPSQVIRDATLSRDARLLYVLLDGRQGAAGRVRVLISTLAADLGASDKSVRRWLAELRDAGLIVTVSTGRSLLVRVANGSRLSTVEPRSVSRGRSDRSPATGQQSTNAREATSPDEQEPAPPPAPLAAGDDGSRDQDYLAAIEHATGHRLRPTTPVREHLAAMRRQEITPAAAAALAGAYLAAQDGRIRKPAAWLAGFVLAAVAAGDRPAEQPATPLPPSIAELEHLAASTCHHGTPGGAGRCALCRHAREQVAA